MVEISDIPDDGANGGAPNKKPQEQPEEPKTPTSLESLPTDLLENIVARVPRTDHPAISSVTKAFYSLIASPGLRRTRSLLAVSEHVLYALIAFPPLLPCWYILYRSELRRVTTLPPMPYGAAVVTIGHKMYVIGGSYGGGRGLSNVTLVDCRTHTCRSLPSMRVARYRAAAGVVNGKIYVMGGCENQSEEWVEWFDVERQVWIGTRKRLSDVSGNFVRYDVVKEKIYGLDSRHCLYVYDPNEGTLKTWVDGNELRGFWQPCSCVVDDMLYTINPGYWVGHPVIVFDPEEIEEGAWRPVRGVFGLPPCLYWYAYESRMANVGGKLVVLVGNQSQWWRYYGRKYISCVEIALERREEGGEISGRVESVHVAFETDMFTAPTIELCRTVIV